MTLHPVSHYARELKPELPRLVTQPARSRLLWLPVHLAVIAAATVAIAASWVSLPIALLLSGVIGLSFSGLVFLGHETLHGAVVRGRGLRQVVGWMGFLPFVVSPRLWVAWHNKVHHGNTQRPGKDPDAYPTLSEYQSSKVVKTVVDHFSLGRRRLSGLLSLAFGFTGQSLQVLIMAPKLGMMTRREHRRALLETGLGVAVWATVAALIGFVPFLLAFVLPLIVANTIVMAFILTNHGLSPLTDVNDPLVNSLSVTTPRWFDFVTLRFGLHVEHHLFPWMSSRHAPLVRDLLEAHWPERYQSMPLGQALATLYRTSRVYQDPVTLVDPHSGQTFPTLVPRLAVVDSQPALQPALAPALLPSVATG